MPNFRFLPTSIQHRSKEEIPKEVRTRQANILNKQYSDVIIHYDTVAGAFLAIAGTILALLVGFLPILKAENYLTPTAQEVVLLATIALAFVVVMNILGLALIDKITRKRNLIILSAIPLLVAFSLIIYDVTVFI